MARSPVAVQIASDLFEYQEKARNIQVYLSTFDTGIGQIRGELNSYLQSSSATALLTSSFTGQGILTTATALAIMLGADVGLN